MKHRFLHIFFVIGHTNLLIETAIQTPLNINELSAEAFKLYK